MKKGLYFLLIIAVALLTLPSCSKEETYADQKENEKKAIDAFLKRDIVVRTSDGSLVINVGRIKEITEDQFVAQGYKTNLELNEYVKLQQSGVYLQIREEGYGRKIESGGSARLAYRFVEYNIMGDSVQLSNLGNNYAVSPEIVDVTNNSGTFSGTISTEGIFWASILNEVYGTNSVPSGWLVPLRYIKVGNPDYDGVDAKCAEIRMILPHTQGHVHATGNVYPTFYAMTIEEVK